VKYGAATPTAYLDVIDDGDVLWVYREYFFDPSSSMRQRTDSELAGDLVAFVGRLQDTEIIIPPNCQSFLQEMRQTSLWCRESSKKEDDTQVRDTIRIMGTLMTRKKLRVHVNCVNTIHQIASYAWSETRNPEGVEVPVTENSEACIALRHMVREKVPTWRSTQQ
jgi:hypothetical protein